MAFAPDGRLFVTEQRGTLRVVLPGSLFPLSTPVITLSVSSTGERGLLGVAVDPAFATNGFVYVYYTVPSPLHNRVSRFTVVSNVAAPSSEFVLLDLDPLSATNHNGGALLFDKDGFLFVASGENAVPSNSQSLTNVLGKVLRLNADGTIPPSNPFYGTTTGSARSIWAYGLRNPFTIAYDSVSGTVFINDVGQLTFEEVNVGVAGANYGWPATEGYTGVAGYTSPLLAYSHASGCAITGGVLYRAPPSATRALPSRYDGAYFFADYCGNWVTVIRNAVGAVSPAASALFTASSVSAPVDIDVAPDGSLWVLCRGTNSVVSLTT
jgi:glucose/arabinose dehydrogenase